MPTNVHFVSPLWPGERAISRHLGDIIAEIRALHQAGYQEAVLTGVHLGSYGADFGNGVDIATLVESILEKTAIPRLRLSSLEPWDIPPDFFKLWGASGGRLLPHLHMPLQSGSDTVLRRMARKTRRDSFRELADAARADIPDLNLTTDIIVGFPGESDAEFEESLDFVREIGFSRLHAFPYSPRPGTAAASMPDQLSKQIEESEDAAACFGPRRNALGRQFHSRICRQNGQRAVGIGYRRGRETGCG